MQISENELRTLVIKIAETILSETHKKQIKSKIYVMAPNDWDERYLAFFNQETISVNFEAYAVVPDEWQDVSYITQLMATKACKGIILRKAVSFNQNEAFLTVFPVVPKEQIVKTALCLEDDFLGKWITSCIEEGKTIAFLKSGLQKFTGKEPKAYVDKIMAYYQDVLSYGIWITDIEGLIALDDN